MALSGYACLGGTEIFSNCRTSTYAANGWSRVSVSECYCCDPLEWAKAHGLPGGYTNPKADKAPWFSDTEPDSEQFGGLYVTSVEGLGPGAYTREVTDSPGGGGFHGRPRQAAPVVTVTGVLLGQTCCSIEYGLRWLTNVLRGACDEGVAAGCGGADLLFYDCCPTFCPAGPDPAVCVEPWQRLLKGVSLVSGPTVTERRGVSCGSCPRPGAPVPPAGGGAGGCSCTEGQLVTVTFQLAASQPCVYHPDRLIRSGIRFKAGPGMGECVKWVTGPCPTRDRCDPLPDCLVDPLCPPPPNPPRPPAAVNPCVCHPLRLSRAAITVPNGVIPEFHTAVPVVAIASGSLPLRHVTLRFYANPQSLPVDQLDPCAACGEVTLSQIPANSTFVMNGPARTVTVKCPGSAPTDASPLLGSAGGRLPFQYPSIECGGAPYTLVVEADAVSIAPNAAVALSVALREC